MNRLSLILLIVVLGLAVGCRRINPPGGASGSRAEAARKKAESLAIAAVDGAAEAEARSNPAFAHGGSGLFSRAVAIVPQGAASQPISKASTPPERKTIIESPPPTASIVIELQPKAPPRAGPSPIIHARVSSFVPAANESEADEEAINAARDLVEKKLAELDPPVKYRPSANEVKNEFLRRDSRSVTTLKETTGPRAEAMRRVLKEQLHLSPEEIDRRVNVEYDVEVTADQVRHLRTRDRLGDTLRVFGGLSVIALAGFLFLRADEWTKGYLTRWLAMAAVLLAGGTAAALYFV
jgi:hypothetical protein